MSPIEFYFDFSSPYSYLAAEAIEPLAAKYKRTVDYKPMLLGVAFKTSGMAPLTEIPLKGDYSKRDFARSARFAGVPFNMPHPFPVSTVTAARALLWLKQAHPARVRDFVHGLLRAYFVEGRNIGEAPVVAQVADEIGLDAAEMAVAVQEPAIKDQLKRHVDEAIARGVFGAPFFFIDGEPFWGNDRLPQLERWLAHGPF
ncbi:MAG TPA: 2-hydroxychromene-2-carboxylate isomerase [Burkholderiaceae bacterium]|jgi:2-hydroxychromene-2-carboxylate isomerase|nr:2-hydroxychromene-2-carboxylate isomerase [Burkholderiaceae bacterium]